MYYISRRTFKKFFRGQLTGNWKGILDGLNEAIELAFIDAEEEEKNVIDEETGGLTSEGADIVLTNTALSLRMGSLQEFADAHGCKLIAADATSLEDLGARVDGAMEHFGGPFDFVLHSIGMSPNVRKGRPYESLDYGFLSKTLDISALSFHKLLHTLYEKDALKEWGSVVALTYIAAERTFAGYNDMADAKALLQSIARSFGMIYGASKHVRVNTVSQSPTATTAGQGADAMNLRTVSASSSRKRVSPTSL